MKHIFRFYHAALLTAVFARILLASIVANAQDIGFAWANRLGGSFDDESWSVAVDVSGNIYTVGYFQGMVDFDPGPGEFNLVSAGNFDIFVRKMDVDGHFIWARRMGGSATDWAFSIALDVSGNVYITGRFQGTADFDPGPAVFNLSSAGNFDIFVSKLDTAGNFMWARRMGGSGDDRGYFIALDASGNIYTAGYFSGTSDFNPDPLTAFNLISVGSSDIFVSKLDVDGNFVWARRMGGSVTDWALYMTLDLSGNIYTTGRFQGTADFDPGPGIFNLVSGGNFDIYVSKLDTAGNFVWAKQMGGSGYEGGYAIASDTLGNIYITGEFEGTADFDPGPGVFNLAAMGMYDTYVCKLDTAGNFLWAKQIGGDVNALPYCIVMDASGKMYITGSFQGTVDFDPGPDVFNMTSAGSYDIFICQLDTSGSFAWARQVGGGGWDDGLFITLDTAGNVYLTGVFSETVDFDPGQGVYHLTSAGNWDAFILRLSPCTDPAAGFSFSLQGASVQFSDTSIGAASRHWDFGDGHTGTERNPVHTYTAEGVYTVILTVANACGDTSRYEQIIGITVGVFLPQFLETFAVWPNPAAGQFTLYLEGKPQKNTAVELFDDTGRAVLCETLDFQSGSVQKAFSCHHLPPGSYLIYLRTNDGTAVTKVVVQR